MAVRYAKTGVSAATADRGVRDTVSAILDDIRARGDDAVRDYSARFDHWSPLPFRFADSEIERPVARLPKIVLDNGRYAQAQADLRVKRCAVAR